MAGARLDVETAPARIRRLLAEGVKPRQLLFTATALGAFDLLKDGARTGPDMAGSVGADPDALHRVLRGLVALEILREEPGGAFALAPPGRLLCRGTPGSLRGEVLLGGAQERAWTALFEGTQSGQTPFAIVNNKGIFDYIFADPDVNAAGHTGMAETAWSDTFASIADACPLPDTGLIIDIGGGRGDLLAAMLRRAPGLHGLLFDAAVEAAGSAAFLAGAGLADRCRVQVGDFFAEVPADGDIYVLCRILHDWDDAAAGTLLDRCRTALSPSARLLIVERVRPERVADDPGVALLDLNMLVEVGGRQRSLPEYRALLAAHGFTLDQVIDRRATSTILVARPTA